MKFKTIDELIRYIVNEPINLEHTDIVFNSDGLKKEPATEKKPVKENFDVKIKTFFDSPSVAGSFGEENILFVESVEGNKDFCGAGRVNVLGREIMTNLCESDGTAYVKLSIDIDGTILENVSFKLQASDSDTRNTICVRNNILDD